MSAPLLIVLMGVSGSGKSTVGELLASALHCEFMDGDDLHPPANIEKMSQGMPLDDLDRAPWLDAVGAVLRDAATGSRDLVVACSALRRSYRDRIRARAAGVTFVLLDGSFQLLHERMSQREHFMPVALLSSQLATLEPLDDDELGFTIGIERSPQELATSILARVILG